METHIPRESNSLAYLQVSSKSVADPSQSRSKMRPQIKTARGNVDLGFIWDGADGQPKYPRNKKDEGTVHLASPISSMQKSKSNSSL